jgi:hypothetical protein
MEKFNHVNLLFDQKSLQESRHDFARNALALSESTGSLYIDMYIASEDIDSLPAGTVYFDPPTPPRKSLLNKLLPISAISLYVCVEIKIFADMIEIWGKFAYSSPRLYRILSSDLANKNVALKSPYVESFQWLPLGNFASLLGENICIFRDLHDEIGVEGIYMESNLTSSIDIQTLFSMGQVSN